jgi:hypothetical protein
MVLQKRCGGRGLRVIAGRIPAASDLVGIYEDVGAVLIALGTSSVPSFRFSTSVSDGPAMSAIPVWPKTQLLLFLRLLPAAAESASRLQAGLGGIGSVLRGRRRLVRKSRLPVFFGCLRMSGIHAPRHLGLSKSPVVCTRSVRSEECTLEPRVPGFAYAPPWRCSSWQNPGTPTLPTIR